MNYEEFKRKLINMLREGFDDNIDLILHQGLKTNLGKVDILSIVNKEEEDAVCVPAACLQEYYEWHQREYSIDRIALAIIDDYYKDKRIPKQVVIPLLEEIKNYEKIKGRVYYRILNAEKNQDLFSEVPYLDFLDLKIVFYILAVGSTNEIGSIIVNQKLMDEWEISTDELCNIAMENTPKLFPVQVNTIGGILGNMQIESDAGQMWEEDLVVSNHVWINGFGVILYPGILQEIAQRADKDMIILPSSIHEAILIPYDNRVDINEIQGIVRRVNDSLELQSEVLSNEVYLFEREKGTIHIVGEGDNFYVQNIG